VHHKSHTDWIRIKCRPGPVTYSQKHGNTLSLLSHKPYKTNKTIFIITGIFLFYCSLMKQEDYLLLLWAMPQITIICQYLHSTNQLELEIDP
jgi:hypothetical protein